MSDPTPPTKTPLLDRLRNWWPKPNPPQPDPTPAPTPAPTPDRIPYLRVWALLRDVNFKDIWLVLFSVPVLVFFALSGVLAWLVVAVRFLLTLWRVFS